MTDYSASKPSAVFEEMAAEEFSGALADLINDAAMYQEQLGEERIAAQKLFDAEDYGNEVDGRSKVHSSDVRDSILAKIPSFLRVLAGSKNVCQVVPHDEQDVNLARDQSDAIDYFFHVKNDGFKIIHNAVHDAELKKCGIVHFWAEHRIKNIPVVYKDFTQEMIDLLKHQPDTVVMSVEEDEADETATSAQADPRRREADHGLVSAALKGAMENAYDDGADESPEDPFQTFTVYARRMVKDVAIRVDCVPPEEFLIDRSAKSVCTAALVGRRRELTLNELVSLGYDADEILEHGGDGSSGMTAPDIEAQTRVSYMMTPDRTPAGDISMRKYVYSEVFHRIDKDGLGAAPLRKTCVLGDAAYVLHDEIYPDDAPFAILCGNPIPHAAIGLSTVDMIAELQVIKTQVLRNTLDSLANSIFPRTAFDQSKVNTEDLFNSEPGALVRVMGQPAASIQELTSTFVGPQSLQVIAYLDDVKMKRIGVGDGTNLKGDELQSTTAVAAQALVSAGQDRLELECRHYAEGLKAVFKGLLALIIRHVDKPLPIRSRDGTFRQVDPRQWDPDAEIVINTAMGKGSEQTKIALLQQILGVQTQLLSGAGLQQPLVGPQEVRNTLEDLANAMGEPGIGRWFKAVPQGWAPPAPDKQLDPMFLQAQATALQAQVAQQKAQGDHLIALEKLRNESTHNAAKLAQDKDLAIAEMQLKYGGQVNQAGIDADIERTRLQRDSEVATALGMAELQHKASENQLDREHAMLNASLSGQPQQGQMGQPNGQLNAGKGPASAAAPAAPVAAATPAQPPAAAPPAKPGV